MSGKFSSTSSSRIRPRHLAQYVHIQESQIEEDDEISQDNIISKQSAARKSFKTCCLTVFKPRRLTFVEPIMFFFMFSRYLYLALIELYFYQKFGLKTLNNDNSSTERLLPNHSFCINSSLLDDVLGNGTNDKVEGETAFVILLTTIPDYVISVLVCLTAGPLSDRYGRKLPLLFALIGNTLASTLNVLLVYFDVGFYYFISTSFLMGITGGFTIIVTVSLAYVADVSSKKSLTYRIGILHATSYISQALSDAVTGQWLKRSGCNFNPMLWLALSSSVLGVIYLIFLKEPFTKEVRMAKFKEKGSTSLFSMFFRGFKIFFGSEYSKWRLWLTMAILSITIFNAIGVFQLLTLFQVHKPLEWGPGLIGWYGLTSTLIQTFSIFCLLPIFVYLKVPDSIIVLVALLITSGINVYTGFLKKTWEMFFVCVLTGLDSIVLPVIRSIFSKLVSSHDQGSLFGVVTGVQSLSAAISSALYNETFRQILKHHLHPGWIFVIMGVIGLLPIPLLFILFLKRKSSLIPDEVTIDTKEDNEATQTIP